MALNKTKCTKLWNRYIGATSTPHFYTDRLEDLRSSIDECLRTGIEEFLHN